MIAREDKLEYSVFAGILPGGQGSPGDRRDRRKRADQIAPDALPDQSGQRRNPAGRDERIEPVESDAIQAND